MPMTTKKKISDTCLDIISKKGIDKISIKEVIELCNISRQTFYYHFQDIVQVIEWTIEEKNKEILSLDLDKHERFEQYLSIMMNNYILIQKLLNSTKYGSMRDKMELSVRISIECQLKKFISEFIFDYSDYEIALDFYAGGITAVFIKYGSEKESNITELCSTIIRIITGQVFHSKF